MKKPLEDTRKAVISIFTMIGYTQRKLQFITYANMLFQFAWFYLMKIINQDKPLNQALQAFTTTLTASLISKSVVAFSNLFVVLIIFIFTITLIVFRKKQEEEQINSKECFNANNLSALLTKIYIVFKILIVPLLVINLTEFNTSVRYQNMVFGGSFFIAAIAVFNVLFITVANFIYSGGMLLGFWTVIIAFLSLQWGFIDIALKIVSILVLIALSLKRSCLEKILILLLIFVFTMDFLSFTASVTISIMHFVLFNVMIIACQVVKPQPRFIIEVERQNEVILQSLEKLNKGKKFEKKKEITLLSIIFKNKEKIKQFSNIFAQSNIKKASQTLQNVNVHSFEWLSLFFRAKIEVNLKENPNNVGCKLQKTIFQLRYQKLNVRILHEILTLTKQAQNTFFFKDKISMMQIEHLLSNSQLHIKQTPASNQWRIKQTSNTKLILKYSYILLMPLLCYFYFLIYLTDIQTYFNNASLVLQKNVNLKNAIIIMTKKTEKFYQASMIEQLMTKAPSKWIPAVAANVQINMDINLPPEFASYMDHQRKILNYDLCANIVPTNDTLFSNINCYDILDGIMSKGLTQTFILYTDLIQTYGGTYMSQFGNSTRSSGKYPIFMQIIYIRQAVCNILIKLQSDYNTTTFSYISAQNQKIVGDLIKGLAVVPFLFLLMVYIVCTVRRQSNSVIKSFKVLPKTFLLNIKTTKFLKNEEILDKIQMIAF